MSRGDQSISLVLHDIRANIQDILRAQAHLASVELHAELARARAAALRVAVGALAAVCGVFLLLLAAVYALSLVVAPWAAALLVAAGTLAIAGVALAAGLTRFKAVQMAPKTVASLTGNVEWEKRPTS